MHKGWVNRITNDLIFSDDITLKKIRLQSDLIFFFQKLIFFKKVFFACVSNVYLLLNYVICLSLDGMFKGLVGINQVLLLYHVIYEHVLLLNKSQEIKCMIKVLLFLNVL